MTLTELLNSDLTTLTAEARRGFNWWIDELASLVPPSLRTFGTRASNALVWNGSHEITDAAGSALSPGANAAVLVPHDQVLVREVTIPAMTRADLTRMIDLSGDRYFPMPRESVLLTSTVQPHRRDDGTMQTDLAAFPIINAKVLADVLGSAAIIPRAIHLVGEDGRADLRFDFLPAMRAAGLVAGARNTGQIWWALVGIFAALNLATLVWRDTADVERLQALTEAQRPAVAVAQRMVARMRTLDAVARSGSERRGLDNPLQVLALVSAAVPNGAWVQRYAWNGAALQLTGYRARDADVAAALRRVPGFANVKSAQTDSIAETTTGQPFDLTVEISGR